MRGFGARGPDRFMEVWGEEGVVGEVHGSWSWLVSLRLI